MRLFYWKVGKEPLGVLLYCLASTALFFRNPLFFWGRFHIPHDLPNQHYPWSEFISWSLWETGQLPWWNPYSFMGEPFFANVQAAMFYPPRLLMILLGNATRGQLSFWLIEVHLMAHVALAGLGAFVLLRLLGATTRASLAGATVYQLGAFFASQTQHLGAVSAAGWLPWFLAALYRLEQRRDWFSAALSGLALALMVMTGHPPTYMPVLVFAPLLYAFWMWQRHPRLAWQPHERAVLLFAAALLLAAQLSAISWVPGYELGRRSVAVLFRQVGVEGLGLEAATSFVWPNLFNQLRGNPWLSAPTFLHVYQGIPALLLVLGGLAWLARSPRARPILAAAAVALLWMFGETFFVSQLVYLVFPSSLRGAFHAHFVLCYFSLFFAVLAGLALDGYERGERRTLFGWRFCARAGVGAGFLALLVYASGMFVQTKSPFVTRATAAGTSLLLVALALALCGLLLRGHSAADPPARRRLSAALCGLILFDLLAIGSNAYVINTGSGDGQNVPAAVHFLRARLGQPELYRVDTSETSYDWRGRVPLWRLPTANGINPLMLKDVLFYRAPFSRMGDRQFDLVLPRSPLLDLAGIRYIVTPRDTVEGARLVYQGSVNVFENSRAYPRFFLVGAVVGSRDVSDAARMIHAQEVDPSRVAVVLDGDVGHFAGLAGPATSNELGTVDLLEYLPNEIRLRVRASRPAVLVATETYWHDWRATVDGEPARLVRADGMFRAIAVAAGVHEVRMFIVPEQLYWGAAVSGVGLLLTGFCLLWPGARRRVPL